MTVARHSRDVGPVAEAMLQRQDRFLEGLAKYGNDTKGCRHASVDRDTVRRWKNEDVFNFNTRYRDALDEYTDGLEDLLDTYNRGIKPGQTPIGILAALNANRPDKWRPNSKISLEVPNELVQQLRQLQELGNQRLDSSNKQPDALNEADSSKIVDGESRLVDGKPLPWEE